MGNSSVNRSNRVISDKDSKLESLSVHLSCEADDIREMNDNTFKIGKEEYLVLSDGEADDMCETHIKDSLWAFNADFILSHSDLPREAESMIKGFQETQCENANDTIFALIKDFDHFVNDAISCDGRGHFLSQYDGEEDVSGDFYIYRVN